MSSKQLFEIWNYFQFIIIGFHHKIAKLRHELKSRFSVHTLIATLKEQALECDSDMSIVITWSCAKAADQQE